MRDCAREFTDLLAGLDGPDLFSAALRIAEDDDLRDQFGLLTREVEALIAIETGKGAP